MAMMDDSLSAPLLAGTKGGLAKSKDKGETVERMVAGVAEGAPPFMRKYLEKLAPVIAWLAGAAEFSLPYVVKASRLVYQVYLLTPGNVLRALIGLVFCFFGGTYLVLFAAIEAVRMSGWESTKKAIGDIMEQTKIVLQENKKDDDGDSSSVLDQITNKQILMRKVNLVMTKVDPQVLNVALGALWITWIAVIATLKVEFAKTVTLALTIADFLQKPVDLFITPAATQLTPKEYRKWPPVIVNWMCRAVGISIAWYIQAIISAVASGVRGGLMFSRNMMAFAKEKGWTLGGFLPENHEDTYMDEIAGWTLAALGVYFQIFIINFSVPFPLNLVMWPFGMANEYLKWQVTVS